MWTAWLIMAANLISPSGRIKLIILVFTEPKTKVSNFLSTNLTIYKYNKPQHKQHLCQSRNMIYKGFVYLGILGNALKKKKNPAPSLKTNHLFFWPVSLFPTKFHCLSVSQQDISKTDVKQTGPKITSAVFNDAQQATF